MKDPRDGLTSGGVTDQERVDMTQDTELDLDAIEAQAESAFNDLALHEGGDLAGPVNLAHEVVPALVAEARWLRSLTQEMRQEVAAMTHEIGSCDRAALLVRAENAEAEIARLRSLLDDAGVSR